MVSDGAATLPFRAGNSQDDRVLARVFAAYMVSATIWLVLTTAVGLLVSFKFAYPDFATTSALSFGRLRAIHTNGTFYAWASQALIGLPLFIAARSSDARLYSERLAWISLALLNLAGMLGTITLDLGALTTARSTANGCGGFARFWGFDLVRKVDALGGAVGHDLRRR